MFKPSTIKVFILAVLVIVSAFLFWQNLANVYLKGNLNTNSLFWLGIWLLFFLVFWLFFSLLVESKAICFVIYLAILAIFFLFFSFHYYLLVGLVVLFLIFIVSRALMQKERNERLKISLRAVFKSGLKLILLFLALFLGLLAYLYPLIKIDEKNINLPPQILAWVAKPFGGTISKTLPFFEAEMTIDEMLSTSLVMEKLDSNPLSPELIKKIQNKNLKETDLQELLKDPEVVDILRSQAKGVDPKVLAKQRNELAKKLDIELRGDEKIVEVIHKLASKQLQSLLGPYIKYLPIISAALIFIVLTSIFFPFSWIVILVASFIFMILKTFRLVRIEKVMKEGEDIKI